LGDSDQVVLHALSRSIELPPDDCFRDCGVWLMRFAIGVRDWGIAPPQGESQNQAVLYQLSKHWVSRGRGHEAVKSKIPSSKSILI
jgi:hypothetical protein